MQDSSTWLLLCHCFSGSLHQPSSPPTQHHSSQAVWQMAAVLTPLEPDNRENPDVRSRSHKGVGSWCPAVHVNRVYTGICEWMAAFHLLEQTLKEITEKLVYSMWFRIGTARSSLLSYVSIFLQNSLFASWESPTIKCSVPQSFILEMYNMGLQYLETAEGITSYVVQCE